MNDIASFDAFSRYVNPDLGRWLKLTGGDLKLVRADGCVVEDHMGTRYDDWVCACGSFNLGHNPVELKKVVLEHLEKNAPNLYEDRLNPYAGDLAEALVTTAGEAFETVAFGNSGSEAVEMAIKTALLATGRKRIAHAQGAYHGTTLGALSCMTRGFFRDPFAGALSDSVEIPFNDIEALERVLSSGDVAGFIVEPIQMEAGVRIADDEYLRSARDLCARYGTLLIFDEIQTGMGRTGKLFAWQWSGATPDMFTLAKSLGGGVVPIGATVMAKGVWERSFKGYPRCLLHPSTFAGNALVCRVALKTLAMIDTPAFLSSVVSRGEMLFPSLEKTAGAGRMVERISWRGLIGGIKFREVDHPWLRWEEFGAPDLKNYSVSGPLILERLQRERILAQVCGHDWSVVRVEPPLIVDAETCSRFVAAIERSVRWLEENA